MDGWDVPRVVQDGDGDYPFRSGTTACYADLLADQEERAVAAELAGLLPRVLALNSRSEAWQPVTDALRAWVATRQGTQVPRRGTAR